MSIGVQNNGDTDDEDGMKCNLRRPTGISILGERVYVTDNKQGWISIFDTAGNHITIIGQNTGLKKPWDNQVDNEGNLIVADVGNHRIVEFNQWGFPILVFGIQGDSAGQFKKPYGVGLSSDGKYLYVCDTYNNRVQKFLMRFEPQRKLKDGIMAWGNKSLIFYALNQNYPNPFTKKTSIGFTICVQEGREQTVPVSLKIYDISGRVVKTLINSQLGSGRYTAVWNGYDEMNRRVSSGVYFCELNVEDQRLTRKLILVK